MKTNHWAQVIIIVVVIAMLATAGVSHAAAPVSSHTIEFAGNVSDWASTEAGQPETQPGDAPEGLSAGEWSSMQDLMRAAQYQFTWQVSDGAWAYRAHNRAHDISLSLAADGLHAVRYGAEGEPLWDFGLSLAAYGEQTFPAAIAEGSLSGSRERVEYQWSPDVVEWYLNSADGVEHGLTLAAPPKGADGSTLELTFALRGSLIPELDSSEQALRLKDSSGSTALLYNQLAVYDAAGSSLPAHFSLSPGGEGRGEGGNLDEGCGEGKTLHITIDTSSAAYPLTVDPLLQDQTAKLTPSYIEENAHFGRSVAISGDTIVVGAPDEDRAGTDRGAAYVFDRDEGAANNWGEVKKLTASDANDYDYFGKSVAISGNRIVVGAYMEDGDWGTNRGAAYIYGRDKDGADNWGQIKKLMASNPEDWDYFGWSVAISGWTVVVGAKWEGGAGAKRGAAYVFGRNCGGVKNWGQMKKLTASNPEDNDEFGCSVSISGDIIVVGASLEDGQGSDRGAAYVYYRDEDGENNWGQVKKLIASNPENNDHFGDSVAISGDTIVVGAGDEDGSGTDRGAVYVFNRNQDGADNWGQVKKRTASDADDHDYFGESVGISGDTIIVGAYGEDGAGSNRGAAYIFERNVGGADSWGRVKKLIASDPENIDHFGKSAAINEDTVVVGAYREDGAVSDRGAAYVFDLQSYQTYMPLVIRDN